MGWQCPGKPEGETSRKDRVKNHLILETELEETIKVVTTCSTAGSRKPHNPPTALGVASNK